MRVTKESFADAGRLLEMLSGLRPRTRTLEHMSLGPAKRLDRIAARLVTEAIWPLVQGAEWLTLALDDTHTTGGAVAAGPRVDPTGSRR
jgi:hypothetical protein